jgi:hypothetical protein
MATAALVPNFGFALVAFTLIGVGENLLVGAEVRLVRELVAERLLGRVFGFKDVLENMAFVSAFAGAGTLLSLAGDRRLVGAVPPRGQTSAPAEAYSDSHDVRYPSRHRIGKKASSSSLSPGRRYRE